MGTFSLPLLPLSSFALNPVCDCETDQSAPDSGRKDETAPTFTLIEPSFSLFRHRKPSVSSTLPSASPAPSLAEEIRMGSCTPSSARRKSSGGRSRDVSSINDAEHTRETEDTHFIRAVTGRGSIRKGPAPTKASQLRQLVRKTT